VEVTVLPDSNYLVGTPAIDTVFLQDAPFDAWRLAEFTAQELMNPPISGPNGDPDLDGLSNLLEYAFGFDPHIPDSGNGFHLVVVSQINQLKPRLRHLPPHLRQKIFLRNMRTKFGHHRVASADLVIAFGDRYCCHFFTRRSVAIQFTSHVLPPSSETACSKWHERGVMSEITNRTRIARPFRVSCEKNSPRAFLNSPTVGGLNVPPFTFEKLRLHCRESGL
jgi:hypothetical protein